MYSTFNLLRWKLVKLWLITIFSFLNWAYIILFQKSEYWDSSYFYLKPQRFSVPHLVLCEKLKLSNYAFLPFKFLDSVFHWLRKNCSLSDINMLSVLYHTHTILVSKILKRNKTKKLTILLLMPAQGRLNADAKNYILHVTVYHVFPILIATPPLRTMIGHHPCHILFSILTNGNDHITPRNFFSP